MTILSYFCGFFLFPLPKLLFDLFQKLWSFKHIDACSRKDLRTGPDRFMGPLRLSRIEIFLRMRRGTLWHKRCADAASGHIVHDISKVRGACLFTRSGELWCLKFSGIFQS